MGSNESTIEADVVEIDGVSVEPVALRNRPASRAAWAQWDTWQGKVKRLDMRWWPLWVISGFFALVAIVAIAMVVLVLLLTYRIFSGVLVGFAHLFFPSHILQRR